MADILLIAGLSGAGRSQAADDLEDLGWFVVDNMPTELIDKVVEIAAVGESLSKLALVVGTPTAQVGVIDVLKRLRKSGHRVRMLFLDATNNELIKRYGATSLLLLQPDPTPYSASHPDEFLVVNRSVSTIVVVSMYNQTYQAEGATLKPGQQTPVDSAPGDGTVLKALFYVTPLEMYADVRDGGLKYADASHDIQMGVADKYRSLAFELNPQFGFTGTITVFDNVATDENIVLFESMMRHQVLPIMNILI